MRITFVIQPHCTVCTRGVNCIHGTCILQEIVTRRRRKACEAREQEAGAGDKEEDGISWAREQEAGAGDKEEDTISWAREQEAGAGDKEEGAGNRAMAGAGVQQETRKKMPSLELILVKVLLVFVVLLLHIVLFIVCIDADFVVSFVFNITLSF